MTGHIGDELPRLLTGEASREVVLEAAEHLRSCPDCQQELVSAVVAHASLMSAHRFAPEIVAPPPTPRPDPSWALTRIHGDDDDADEHHDEGPSARLPDMDAVFDRIRDEAAQRRPETTEQPAPAAGAGWRGRRGLLVAAAAAVVLAGGAVGIGYAVDGGSSGGQTVALHPIGIGHVGASATIKGDSLTLDAAALPRLGSNRRYEVWLTNAAGSKMYSIGFMGDGPDATFTVKRAQLGRFSNIEVSRQSDGQIDFSGVSVLRGAYATT